MLAARPRPAAEGTATTGGHARPPPRHGARRRRASTGRSAPRRRRRTHLVPRRRLGHRDAGHPPARRARALSSFYMRSLEALSADRPLVRYDQLGGGKSDKITDTAMFNIAHFVRELDSLRSHLGYDKIHVVGHSWGTILGLEYYRAHPEHVSEPDAHEPRARHPAWESNAKRLVKTLLRLGAEGDRDSRGGEEVQCARLPGRARRVLRQVRVAPPGAGGARQPHGARERRHLQLHAGAERVHDHGYPEEVRRDTIPEET